MMVSEGISSFSHQSNSSIQTINDDDKLWTKILSEVSSKSNYSQQSGTIIILGENLSGKSSLISRLEKIENEQHGSALEYHCINVQNDLRDGAYAYQLGTAGLGPADKISMPVWTLTGDVSFAPLLQFALPSAPSKAVVVLTAPLDKDVLVYSLKRWANVVRQQVDLKYSKEVIAESKKCQERFWQEYVEPVESSMSTIDPMLEVAGLLPLEQGVLTDNCGVSFVVVITKSDLGSEISDQQADRVLVQVRKFCLEIGAALVYTSAKNVKNIQVLYKYLVHRALAFPFTQSAQVIERDSIFVPAGWDGEKKIDILREGITDVDVPLEPTREKTALVREQLIEAEDDQSFLQRLHVAETSAPTPIKKTALLEDGTDSNSPLANFFSNLLKDKPSGKSPAQAAPADAQAQLDRILNESKREPRGEDSSA